MNATPDFSITILFDNRYGTPGMEPAWGFAAAVQSGNKTVLFDTGCTGDILERNVASAGFSPTDFDCIVLSHKDWDHIEGLDAVLPHVSCPVYLPPDPPPELTAKIEARNLKAIPCTKIENISNSICTTGPQPGPRNEQALIVFAKNGPVLITGCAHPGIEHLVRVTKNIAQRDPLLAVGGFHLGSMDSDSVRCVAQKLKDVNLHYVAPCHCTGPNAIEILKQEFGTRFIDTRTGTRIDSYVLQALPNNCWMRGR